MNEEERAEIVARAIDALISGLDPNTSLAADTAEPGSLMDVARQRLAGSRFIAKASLQHQSEVWRAVLRHIEDSEIEAVRASDEPDDELAELAYVIATRRGLAANMFAVAEEHRQQVWERVQARLAEADRYDRLPEILRPFRRRSDVPSKQSTGGGARPNVPPLPLTYRDHQEISQMAATARDAARERVWASVSDRAHIEADQRAQLGRPNRHLRALAVAATLAVIAVALGPVPATGVAGHPMARIGESITNYFGAQEADAPRMSDRPPAVTIEGRDASVGEASVMAGVEFVAPGQVPAGFELLSSRYYMSPVSGHGPGTFVSTYSGAAATIAIYQEEAGATAFAISDAAGASVSLADGTAATLVDGGWVLASGLSWSASGSQSLIFERGGVLVVIEVTAREPLPTLLFHVADAMR